MKQRGGNLQDVAQAQSTALSRVGIALMSEVDENHLLQLIAETACELTGAEFAAFTLRPVNDEGEPLVPSEGSLFYLAAAVGVTQEQEALFRHVPMGGEGLLAPIFRHGIPVRVPDTLAFVHHQHGSNNANGMDVARQAAFAYSHGQLPDEVSRWMGIPRGHPVVRSFLGVPLLDRAGRVYGGLLLGHGESNRFTQNDEALLVDLAAQAAVTLENARLYRLAQRRAQELNAIFESIADGITLVDHQGTLLRENGAARRVRELLKDAPGSETLLQKLARTALDEAAAEDTLVSVADGRDETREYLVSASPLQPIAAPSGLLSQPEAASASQDGTTGAVIVWHDVTERRLRESERQARAYASQLEAVFEAMTDGVFVYDWDGNIVQVNSTARALFAFDAAPDYTSRPLKERLARLVVQDTQGQPLSSGQWPQQRLLSGEVLTGENALEVLVRAFDGRELQVSIGGAPLRDPRGRIVGAVMTVRDITERRRLEQIERRMHSEAERLKDEFIAVAAHELRNPLAALKGYAQMLLLHSQQGKGSELADWQREALDSIDQATRRLNDLTEDLLDVTRLQAGRLELHPEPTDLVALARRVVKRLQPTTEQHHLSVLTSLEYLVALIDSRRVEQVLGNLLSNAIKYSPQGGPVEVVVREESEIGEALLSVRDCGMGIPLHQQARLFGRFERADNAQKIGGTGLGLYICRALVEQHGGRIWFESVEGQGSTFFIALPAHQQDDPPAY
jgi:two-component system phosphate regulon sensor histidine kinase PhoR